MQLTEIGRFRLTQVPVEIGSVRFLQTRAQPKIREFYVAPCVQQQVVWLDVSVKCNDIKLKYN